MKHSFAETRFCDIHHPEIQRIARTLRKNTPDTIETAKNTFYYVRDTIITGYDLYQTKASEVLKKGYGVCWGKSILLMTLLRANGIEAMFGSVPVHRKFIEPLIGNMYHLVNSPYHHCIVHAFLNNRWTVMDTILDRTTYETFFAPKNVSWGISWNGTDDCCLYSESIIGSHVVHTNVDSTIVNKAGNRELPPFMAQALYAFLNRRIWTKTGNKGKMMRPVEIPIERT